MDTSHIISGAELKRFHRARRWWWAGWVCASIASLAGAYLAGERRAYARERTELVQRLVEVRAVQEEQRKVNESYIQAWGEVNTLAAVVTSWGKPIQEMIDLNRAQEVAPTPPRFSRSK